MTYNSELHLESTDKSLRSHKYLLFYNKQFGQYLSIIHSKIKNATKTIPPSHDKLINSLNPPLNIPPSAQIKLQSPNRRLPPADFPDYFPPS